MSNPLTPYIDKLYDYFSSLKSYVNSLVSEYSIESHEFPFIKSNNKNNDPHIKEKKLIKKMLMYNPFYFSDMQAIKENSASLSKVFNPLSNFLIFQTINTIPMYYILMRIYTRCTTRFKTVPCRRAHAHQLFWRTYPAIALIYMGYLYYKNTIFFQNLIERIYNEKRDIDLTDLKSYLYSKDDVSRILKSKLNQKCQEILTKRTYKEIVSPALESKAYDVNETTIMTEQNVNQGNPSLLLKWDDLSDDLTDIEDLIDELENSELSFLRQKNFECNFIQ